MTKFRVTYFYMATGMDHPDRKDYGVHEAKDKNSACVKVACYEYELGTREHDWMMGCLTAIEMKEPTQRNTEDD